MTTTNLFAIAMLVAISVGCGMASVYVPGAPSSALWTISVSALTGLVGWLLKSPLSPPVPPVLPPTKGMKESTS